MQHVKISKYLYKYLTAKFHITCKLQLSSAVACSAVKYHLGSGCSSAVADGTDAARSSSAEPLRLRVSAGVHYIAHPLLLPAGTPPSPVNTPRAE